ncbi:RHS repeat-associated core domain-containing protein [Pseudomonas sp. NPDC088429]|uniref:RHS repeat-associated core domain-containing protein n=1 Tax=Pseudomonas sp. NPDC088429 TaxID=3364455 RepID=UPI0038231B64
MSSGIDAFTPNLTATDSRGLPVRQIAYWRQDVSQREARATIQQHDAAGRLVAQQDPRLLADASAPANLVSIYSLSGKVLSTVSVDAGWRLSLSGEADQALLGWDGRGSQRWTEYDDQIRPIAAFEHAVDAGYLCAERFAYGGDNPAFSARNQCGQLIRHDDPSGTQLFEQFGLAGEVLQQTRHFLQTLESPDWPASVSERDTLLEPGAGFTARTRFNPLGEAIEQTDAKGNRQMISHAVDGLLHEVRLQLAKDVAPKVLVSAIQYNAHGQTERETAGNGVITSLEYAADDGRLSRLQAKRGSDALQDLRYVYDPVGNVLSIEDAALPVRYFANQRIEPVNRYVYDSLYQLINATGWEAGCSNQGPTFSRFDDPASCANYTQNYRYDRGGNLLQLTHDGPQSHGHRLVAAAQSNRCLPVLNGLEPNDEDFRKSFDANGNLLNLQPGQVLRWDLRNQLRDVRPVANDREGYVYGADGMRVRKVRSTQNNARTLISEVRYLPGLELRTHSGTGQVLQVITVQTGRSSVRVLHWESEPPKDISNDQYRYSLNDHLGSCALELDSSGDIISQERYHPFGTTAWFAGRSEIEAGYKTVRYSGQERDATGLYYYGFRYYAPWMQRWLNPDPAGYVDDLNFYKMTINNPLVFIDKLGLAPVYAEGMEAQLAPHTNLIIEQPEANENFFVSYRVQGLKERLSAADELSKGRAEHVANAFTHKVILKTIVMTEPKIKDIDSSKVSKYFNMINKHEWEFKQNYKFKDSGNVFANDIFRHQYKVASEKNKNFGELPSAIRRSKVKNDTTLKTTEGLQSGTPELLDAFFKTPNGKTTQRVIEDFGMVATKVTTEANGKDLDFVVTVKPLGDYQTINTLQVQPKRTSKAAVFTKLTTT